MSSEKRSLNGARSPGLTFGVFVPAVVLGYALLLLPGLARHHFDLSIFVVAGDRFVDAARTLSPIRVLPHSFGYDGQFYYRLALAPFDVRNPAYGVRFDSPPWRMQRILYPLLAWCLSLGRPALVPASLLLINLGGLAAIAAVSLRLTVRLALPRVTPLAIMLWPGFIVTLTHDTTEIVSVALLLAAVDCYLANRLLLYALAGALATLTRETGILLLGGVLCQAMWQAICVGADRQAWRRVAVCGAALVPFLLWREAMHRIWGTYPHPIASVHNLGPPFVGAVTMVVGTAIAAVRHVSDGLATFCLRVFVVGSAGVLIAWCVVVAANVPRALRNSAIAPVAFAWLPIAAVMSLLTSTGPWIEPTAYFRAFSECYALGCLVLAARPPGTGLMRLILAGSALSCVGAWILY